MVIGYGIGYGILQLGWVSKELVAIVSFVLRWSNYDRRGWWQMVSQRLRNNTDVSVERIRFFSKPMRHSKLSESVRSSSLRARSLPRSAIREMMDLAVGRSGVIHLEVGES